MDFQELIRSLGDKATELFGSKKEQVATPRETISTEPNPLTEAINKYGAENVFASLNLTPNKPQMSKLPDDMPISIDEQVDEEPTPISKQVKTASKEKISSKVKEMPQTAKPIEKEETPIKIPTDKTINFGSQEAIAERAQKLRDSEIEAIKQAQIGKALANIGSAINRGKSYTNEELAAFDTPVLIAKKRQENFDKLIKEQQNDPNSSFSQGLKDVIKKTTGYEISGDATAEQLSKIFPDITKAYTRDLEASLKTKELDIRDETQKRLERQNEKQLAYQYEALRENIQARKMMQSAREQIKQDQKNSDRIDKVGKLITGEVASSRSAFGRAANTYANAEKVERLVAGMDPNEIDNRQIAEIARSLDYMLSSGQPTVSGLKKLLPVTVQGDAAKIQEYLMGIPKGAKQGEFVKRMMETIEREKSLAHEQMQRTQKKLLAPYSDLKDDPRFLEMLRLSGIPEDIMSVPQKEEKKADKTSNTQKLIESRSEEENLKRLEELRQKYKK